MLLGKQRLRELRYEDRLPSEPSGEESTSSIRDVPQASAAKNKREPTLLGVAALERRARDATLVGVGLATPTPVSTVNRGEGNVNGESASKVERSTDEIARIEQTCDVSLGDMEVLVAQGAAGADASEPLGAEGDELKEDTQGEWIRFEKSFANATIATIMCAILAFFLLPSGHDAPVPPPANGPKQVLVASSKTNASVTSPDVPSPAVVATLDERSGATPGQALLPASEGAPSTEQALRIEPAQGLAPAHEAVTPASADEKPKRRARTAEERKELRMKRRAARAKREALAKQDDTEKPEGAEKRRNTTTETLTKRARSGGKP